MSSTNAPPPPPLPEQSVLSVEEYAAMLRAIRQPPRHELLATLVEKQLTVEELADELDRPGTAVRSHLDALERVGLVANRFHRDPDDAEPYFYYEATSLGEAILSEGIGELITEEPDVLLAVVDVLDDLSRIHERLDYQAEHLASHDDQITNIETDLNRNLYQPVALGAGSMTAVIGVVQAAAGSITAIPIGLLSIMFWVGLWLLRQ